MAKVRHVNVGESIDDLAEWMDEELHEVLDTDGSIIVSKPPQGFHQIYGIYAKKIGNKYSLILVLDNEPES
jgi:hypothetical protein